MADLAFLEAQQTTLIQAIRAVRRAIEIREANGESTADLRATLADYEGQLAALQKQLALLATQPPPISAGETVAQAQRANDERADVLSPSAPPAASPAVSNADSFSLEQNTDAGTDASVRPAAITQSLPPITARPGPARSTIAGPNNPNQPVPTPSVVPKFDPFEIDGGVNDDAITARPTSQLGIPAPGDDATGGAGVTARINSLFGGDAGRIIPKGNALDEYASYTYSISIYLLSPNDFKQMLRTKTPPKGWQLLIQSAGAPVGGGKIPPDQLTQELPEFAGEEQVSKLGRNEFFDLDLYIDDLSIKHLMPLKNNRAPHLVTEMSFKIYEPNGITFLPNLYKAVQQYVAFRGGGSAERNQVYTAQNFLMAIRFYGYDKDGNLVSASNRTDEVRGSNGQVLQPGQTATIEKFIPFQFTNIKFRIANRITEYSCQAVATHNIINTGQQRGIIPYNVELSSQSLVELLTGPINFVGGTKSSGAGSQVTDTGDETARLLARRPAPATASPGTGFNSRSPQLAGGAAVTAPTRAVGTSGDADAQPGGFYGAPSPPKADAATRANKLTISQGLQEALNRYQAELVAEGTYEYPDIYEIEILEPVIANAQVIPEGDYNFRLSSMIRPQTAKEAKDGETQSVDTNSKNWSITAGQSVVDFIDRVVRSSTYILEQQKFFIDNRNVQHVNSNPAQTVGWYRIGLEAEPTGFYDTKRNDYQYRIKYSVAAYQVNEVKSDYFPRTQFRGTHKVYPYWFTGENTQVLNFEQEFNTLYYIVQNVTSQPKFTSNYLEADRYFYATLQSESSQGQNNMRVYDGSASAASWLYSPGDQAMVKLQIVGDPAWIFQGEIFSGVQSLNLNYAAFQPDGTINPGGREVLFEILFNQPVDYDLSTGLMDAGKFNVGTDTAAREAGVFSTSPAGQPRERYLYRVVNCTSHFRQGRFIQDLEGSIVTFQFSNPTAGKRQQQESKQVGAINATQEQAQVRRIDNAIATQKAQLPVKKGPKPAAVSLPGDSLRVDDYFPQPADGIESPTPQLPATAPTSSTQPVGQPATGAAGFTLGGATGRAAGTPPTATLYLNDGQTVQVSDLQEIQSYSPRASAQARSAAATRLNAAQQAANNPTTAANRQLSARET